MRNAKRTLAALLVVASIACTASANKTAYDVLGVAVTAVDLGMKVYADRVVAGAVPQATQDIVNKDFAVYQQAMSAAQLAYHAWLALGNPPPPALFPSEQIGTALSAAGKVQAEVK
jgi:hypothetical protein